jgi:hypothetical protein
MADLVYVLVMGAFFVLAALFVTFCERVVGSAGAYEPEREEPPDVAEAA